MDRVGAPYLLDPVMGDDPKGLFVAPDLPDAIRRELLPRAAAITPNRFELSLLGDREVDGPARAAEVAAGLGPSLVVATSVPAGEGRIACVGVSEDEARQAVAARLAHPGYGAGDLFAALFAARWRDGWADAMALAAGTVHATIARSSGPATSTLSGAQALFADPPPPPPLEAALTPRARVPEADEPRDRVPAEAVRRAAAIRPGMSCFVMRAGETPCDVSWDVMICMRWAHILPPVSGMGCGYSIRFR